MIDRVQWVSHKNLNDFYFRENFRTDFNQLGSMRTILPKAKMLVLTATASPPVIQKMKEVLLLNDDYVLVSVSPNRANIYLEKIERLANGTGKKAHKAILVPLAEELNLLREKFPLTVIYMKLECMIIAVRVFSDIVGNVISESGDMRLFNVFHSETTPAMKSKVIEELGKKNSYIRVVFATTALGMGVNTRYVQNVIHITPSSSMESYFQEIGRAGRAGGDAHAVLYYNNSDVAANRDNVNLDMKGYCAAVGCLRAYLLQYFGFKPVSQQRCCSNCHPEFKMKKRDTVPKDVQPIRSSPQPEQAQSLMKELKSIIDEFNSANEFSLYDCPHIDSSIVEEIIDKVEYMMDKAFFIQFGIWDDDYLTMMYNVVSKFCPTL